jgi:hypothetical protein
LFIRGQFSNLALNSVRIAEYSLVMRQIPYSLHGPLYLISAIDMVGGRGGGERGRGERGGLLKLMEDRGGQKGTSRDSQVDNLKWGRGLKFQTLVFRKERLRKESAGCIFSQRRILLDRGNQ